VVISPALAQHLAKGIRVDREWVRDFIENISSATIGDMDIPKLVNEKVLHTPNQLFKIRKCSEYTFKNLAEKTLYLGDANEFDDPYDTAFSGLITGRSVPGKNSMNWALAMIRLSLLWPPMTPLQR
jgi:hypothetical protein